MKSTYLIVLGIVIVFALLAGIVVTIFQKPEETIPGTGNNFPNSEEIPTPSSSDIEGTTLALRLSDGSEVMVPNFVQDSKTKVDSQNPGFYLIEEGAAATPDPSFSITYIAATDFFNISLMQEPLSLARQNAERTLQQTLGLSQSQMCTLRYSVATPGFVNEQYSGRSLGFSFCSGAVPLQ